MRLSNSSLAGTIILATVSGIYLPKLRDERTTAGYEVIGDVEFMNRKRETNGMVFIRQKRNVTSDIPESAHISSVDIILQLVMTSEDQSAE